MAVNSAHACGLTAAGAAWGWGFNRYGQVGTAADNDTDNPNPTPAAVTGGLSFATP